MSAKNKIHHGGTEGTEKLTGYDVSFWRFFREVGLLLLCALCVSVVNPSRAQYAQSDFHRLLCAHPYRSLDGGRTFLDLTPEFRFLTNQSRARQQADPFPEWRMLAGHVTDVPKARGNDRATLNPQPSTLNPGGGSALAPPSGILVRVNKGLSSPELTGGAGALVQLLNFPGASAAVDGAPVHCLAKLTGRYQYTTIDGALVTVLSYDHGEIADPEKFAAIEGLKRSNYLALVQAAARERSNRVSRQILSRPAVSNYTITPKR